MAKLSLLKSKRDENERVIKCLVVEDYKNGHVYKKYNYHEFDEIINKTDKMFLTKIYAPAPQEREDVFKLIQKNTVDGKVEISDSDMLTVMFSKFTDLEIDLDDNGIEDVLANPSEFLMQIKSEMDKLLISCIESYVEMHDTLASSPRTTEMLNEHIEKKQEVVNEDELKREQEKLAKEEKRKELERQLAELG